MDPGSNRVEEMALEGNSEEPSTSSVSLDPVVSQKVESWIRKNESESGKPAEGWIFLDPDSDKDSVMSEGSSDSIIVVNGEERGRPPVVLGSRGGYVESLGDAAESVQTPDGIDGGRSERGLVLRSANQVARARSEPQRTYIHKRNQTVNQTLNMMLALTFSLGLGLGIGHFLGLTDDFPTRDSSCPLYQANLDRLKQLHKPDTGKQQFIADEERIFSSVENGGGFPRKMEAPQVPIEQMESIFGPLAKGKTGLDDCLKKNDEPSEALDVDSSRKDSILASSEFVAQDPTFDDSLIIKSDSESSGSVGSSGDPILKDGLMGREDLVSGSPDGVDGNPETVEHTPVLASSETIVKGSSAIEQSRRGDGLEAVKGTNDEVRNTEEVLGNIPANVEVSDDLSLSKTEFYGSKKIISIGGVEDRSLFKPASEGTKSDRLVQRVVSDDLGLDKATFYGVSSSPDRPAANVRKTEVNKRDRILSKAEFYGMPAENGALAHESIMDAASGYPKDLKIVPESDTVQASVFDNKMSAPTTFERGIETANGDGNRRTTLKENADATVEVDQSEIGAWNRTKKEKDRKNYDLKDERKFGNDKHRDHAKDKKNLKDGKYGEKHVEKQKDGKSEKDVKNRDFSTKNKHKAEDFKQESDRIEPGPNDIEFPREQYRKEKGEKSKEAEAKRSKSGDRNRDKGETKSTKGEQLGDRAKQDPRKEKETKETEREKGEDTKKPKAEEQSLKEKRHFKEETRKERERYDSRENVRKDVKKDKSENFDRKAGRERRDSKNEHRQKNSHEKIDKNQREMKEKSRNSKENHNRREKYDSREKEFRGKPQSGDNRKTKRNTRSYE